MEYGMFAKELALGLDVNTNTLRRWSLELEKFDYQFERNDQNQRVYYERDVVTIREFKGHMEKMQSLEKVAKLVTDTINKRNKAEEMLEIIETGQKVDQTDEEVVESEPNLDAAIRVFKLTEEEVDAMINKAVNEATERVAEHLMQRFSDVTERRDRALISELRETMKEKNLKIEESEESEVKEEKKAGFFSFFRKRGKE